MSGRRRVPPAPPPLLSEIQLSPRSFVRSFVPMTVRNFARPSTFSGTRLKSFPDLFFRIPPQLRVGARDLGVHVDGGDPGGHEPGQGAARLEGKEMIIAASPPSLRIGNCPMRQIVFAAASNYCPLFFACVTNRVVATRRFPDTRSSTT